MNRNFIIILCLSLVSLLIVGCSAQPNASDNVLSDAPSNPSSADIPPEPPVVDVISDNQQIVQTNTVTVSDLSRHNSEDDCWIAYDGNVFDVTDYVPMHPGGASKIVPLCGTSDKFENAFSMQHGTSKVSTLEKMGMYKGELI
ncbi:MAG: cytochrome b5 domain-containing protein [Candidatus Woesearchaeota archaeon]